MIEFKPGDTVIPKHGRGTPPRVIASLGSQPSMFGPETRVAIFEDGSFADVKTLTTATSEPSSALDRKIRRLAEVAMSVCHGDCGESDPEWHHEVMTMESKFRKILKARA